LTTAARHDIRDGDDVTALVVAFYRSAAVDDLLGPIFEAAHVDWSSHVPKVASFWSWQLLGRRGYEGNPLRAHEPSHARTPFRPEHYARWLELFESTVDERFAGPVAELAKTRARRMARALRRLLDGEQGAGDEPIEVIMVHDDPRDRFPTPGRGVSRGHGEPDSSLP
jgi:hemoglobin